MAKTTPGLQAALKAVKALQKQQNREADADYQVALSASGAGQATLRNVSGRIEGQALRSALKAKSQVKSLTRAQRAEQRNVREGIAGTTARYGSALGASVASSYAGATAVAAGGAKILASQLRAAKGGVSVQKMVASLANAGVAAQSSAAKYQLAQALQQRAIADNANIAQLTGDLYKMGIDAEIQKQAAEDQAALQFEYFKKQKRWEQRQLDKAGMANLDQITTLASSAAVDMAQLAGSEEFAGNPTGLVDAVAPKFGITEGSAEYNVLSAAAVSMQQYGTAPADAVYQAVERFYGGNPGWSQASDSVASSIGAGIDYRQSYILANLEAQGYGTGAEGYEPKDALGVLGFAENRFGANSPNSWLPLIPGAG